MMASSKDIQLEGNGLHHNDCLEVKESEWNMNAAKSNKYVGAGDSLRDTQDVSFCLKQFSDC